MNVNTLNTTNKTITDIADGQTDRVSKLIRRKTFSYFQNQEKQVV